MYKKITIDGTEYHLVPVEETETTEQTQEPKRTGLVKADGIKIGNGYYYIDENGNVMDTSFDDDDTDELSIELGNAYTDEQLAEDTARANRIRNALRDYAAEHNKVALDWGTRRQHKYYLCYDCEDDELLILCNEYFKHDDIYFDAYETAEAAIEAVGREDVTWLLRDFNPWIGAYKGAGE